MSGRTVWCWSSDSCAIAHWSAGDQALVVVVDTPDGERGLVALDRASGAPLWRQELTGEAAAAPVHTSTAVLLTTKCGRPWPGMHSVGTCCGTFRSPEA
ncbi:PQQ-binding-like beta-propeller repeat protein [Streptomyces chrestomyceticus]|uniref:outer membrane protein assembly factor BamB family protein n=1 Tax=Streptomyces chrestomyceticus TaxID=68185 RepID=UPI0033EA5CB5